jgi:DNA-binding NarL/FixJ family response regulator
VLLDMIMDPGIDGLETYRRMVDRRPGQKAIIATGFSETERVRKAQSLGVGRYIQKPYTFEELGQSIRAELDRGTKAS